jgi:hypothetical protein
VCSETGKEKVKKKKTDTEKQSELNEKASGRQLNRLPNAVGTETGVGKRYIAGRDCSVFSFLFLLSFDPFLQPCAIYGVSELGDFFTLSTTEKNCTPRVSIGRVVPQPDSMRPVPSASRLESHNDDELEAYVQELHQPFDALPSWGQLRTSIVAMKVQPKVFVAEERLPKSSKFRTLVMEANKRRIDAMARGVGPQKRREPPAKPKQDASPSVSDPCHTQDGDSGRLEEAFATSPLVPKKAKLLITPAAFRFVVEKGVPRSQVEALELLATILDGHYEQLHHDLDEETLQRRLRHESMAVNAKASRARAEQLEHFLLRVRAGPAVHGGEAFDHGTAMRLLEGFVCACAITGKNSSVTGDAAAAPLLGVSISSKAPLMHAGTSLAQGASPDPPQLALPQDELRKLLEKRFPNDPSLAGLSGTVFVARHRHPLLLFPELARRLYPLAKNVAAVCAEVMTLKDCAPK